MVHKFMAKRRITEKLFFLVLVCALTFIPALHLTAELRSQIFGLLMAAFFAWMRTWTDQIARKAIPPAERTRFSDRDLHSPIVFEDEMFCARCSKEKPREDWVRWDACTRKAKP
jgi:hypothetical protein